MHSLPRWFEQVFSRILNRVTEGAGTTHHLEILDELSRYIRDLLPLWPWTDRA